MVTIRVPGVAAQSINLPEAGAPQTVPMRDATGSQLMQLGQGVAEAGAGLQRVQHIASVLASHENDARVKEADAAYSDELSGELDKFGQLVGRDAPDQLPAFQKRAEDARKRISSALANEAQRQRFDLAADRRRDLFLNAIGSRAARELIIYHKAESQARRDASIRDYGQYQDDPSAAEKFRGAALQEVRTLGRMAGWADDSQQLKDALLEATTRMHAGVVESRLASGRAKDADAYLREHQGEIVPAALNELKTRVGRETMHMRANERAVQLMGSAEAARAEDAAAPPALLEPERNVGMAGQVLAERVAAGELQPDEARATLDRFEFLEAQRSQRQASRALGALGEAERILLENPNMRATQLPEAVQAELHATGMFDAAQRFDMAKRSYQTETEAWEGFLSVPNETLKRISPEQLEASMRWRMSPGDWRYAQARHAQARGAATPKDMQVISITDRLENGWRQMKQMPVVQELGEADRNRIQMLRGQLDLSVQSFVATNKREPNDDELQKLIDRLLVDKAREPGFFGDGTAIPLSAMTDAEIDTAVIGPSGTRVLAMPDAERVRIGHQLRANRMPFTSTDIYEEWVRQGTPGIPRGMTPEQFANKRKAEREALRVGKEPPKEVGPLAPQPPMATEGFMRPGPK